MRELTCIICPKGCEVTVGLEGDELVFLSGKCCKKGTAYVRQELADPHRNLATSVLVQNGRTPLASVRLTQAIPKARMFDVLDEIKKLQVAAPVGIGQVLIANVLGLGSDVIATRAVAATEPNG